MGYEKHYQRAMAIQAFAEGIIMTTKEMRNFALRDENGNEIRVFGSSLISVGSQVSLYTNSY
jgi:DMSO/TMAO reductase YedYZ molybdopterin-dependent catalytic subunit